MSVYTKLAVFQLTANGVNTELGVHVRRVVMVEGLNAQEKLPSLQKTEAKHVPEAQQNGRLAMSKTA